MNSIQESALRFLIVGLGQVFREQVLGERCIAEGRTYYPSQMKGDLTPRNWNPPAGEGQGLRKDRAGNDTWNSKQWNRGGLLACGRTTLLDWPCEQDLSSILLVEEGL